MTLPSRESWFCIDLLKMWVRPTHYTLRHYSSWDTEALRDWKLQVTTHTHPLHTFPLYHNHIWFACLPKLFVSPLKGPAAERGLLSMPERGYRQPS